MTNYEALDTFMSLYLGPDSYYLSGATDVDQSIDFYLASEDDDVKYELLADLVFFVDEYADDLVDKFNRRYRHSIHNKDDVKKFLQLVNQKVNHALEEPENNLFPPEEKASVVSFYHLNNPHRPIRPMKPLGLLHAGRSIQIEYLTISEESSEYLVQAVASLQTPRSLVLSKTSNGLMIAEVEGTTLPVVPDIGKKLRKARSAVRMAISETASKRDKQRS